MTIYPRCRKRTFWTKPGWWLRGVLCDCSAGVCYPMGPEGPREFRNVRDETVRLLALKDGVIAKLREQRDRARRERIQKEAEVNRLVPFYEACISARAEIAALTEQRDVVTVRLEELVAWAEQRDRAMEVVELASHAWDELHRMYNDQDAERKKRGGVGSQHRDAFEAYIDNLKWEARAVLDAETAADDRGYNAQTGGGDELQPVSEEGLAASRKRIDALMDPIFGPLPQTGGGDAPTEEQCEAALDAYIDAGSLLTTDGMRAALIGARGWARTGGGGTGERTRAILDLIEAQPGCRIDPHARDYAAKLIADFHREGADLDDDVRRGGPEYFRAALLESRREGYREGAEAMREVCAGAARQREALRGDSEYSSGASDMATEIAEEIEALPIPWKTK